MFKYSKFFDERDTFPYWRKILPDPETMFSSLRTEKFVIQKKGKYPIIVRTYPGDHRKTDGITDHFTEYARVDASFKNMRTPRSVWDEVRHAGQCVPNPEYEKIAGLPDEDQREFVYGATRECSNFNVALALWIVRTAIERNRSIPPRSFRILDPSAGWGDRLVSALAADVGTYVGFDPNKRLQSGYAKILETLGADRDSGQFRVFPEPFGPNSIGEGKIGRESFDLVLTSPPYFSMENYEPGHHESDQSAAKYPTFKDWAKNMYTPYLTTAWEALKPGGTMAISIENVTLQVPARRGQRQSDDPPRGDLVDRQDPATRDPSIGRADRLRRSVDPSERDLAGLQENSETREWAKFKLADMTRDIVRSFGGVELDRFGLVTEVAGQDVYPRWTYYWVKPQRG